MNALESKQVGTTRGSGWPFATRQHRITKGHPLPRVVPTVMSMGEWLLRERRARGAALRARSEQAAWRVLNREARRVLRAYTTSFFVVSRFLPRAKREEVEAVYAAVRYPDEVVDTFPLERAERLRLLEDWREHY